VNIVFLFYHDLLIAVCVLVHGSWSQYRQWGWSLIRRRLFCEGCKWRLTGSQW